MTTSLYGDKPFGIREVKVKAKTEGATTVALSNSQLFKFTERIVSAELKGDDEVKGIVAFPDTVEFEMDEGGIPLEAWAVMTGRTASETGTTPNRTKTLQVTNSVLPYFELYGRSVGEGIDDVYVHIPYAKLTGAPSGEFKLGSFYVGKSKGMAKADPDTHMLYEIVQEETAADLP